MAPTVAPGEDVVVLAQEKDTTRRQRRLYPWRTRILNKLALLDPRLWWGAWKIQAAFLPLNVGLIVETLVRVFLPMLVLLATTTLTTPLLSSATAPTSSAAIFGTSLASPWSVASMTRILPGISSRAKVVWYWKANRCPALPEALACLDERVSTRRAYRTRRYDVYLPATDDTSPTSDYDAKHRGGNKKILFNKAILILPGALVEHAAYSQIAARLSDAGLLVTVLSVEPIRMASEYSPCTYTKALRRITQQISKRHPALAQEWIIGGHSFGGNRVATLLVELSKSSSSPSSKSRVAPFTKFVFWACPNVEPFDKTEANANVQLLSIQGQHDPLFAMRSKGFGAEFAASLKSFANSREIVIKGGSHQQFGTYKVRGDPNNPNDWRHGDKATISRQDQQDQIGNLTASFCFQ